MAGIGEPVRLASFKSGRVLVARDVPNADAVTVAVEDVGIHSVAISGTSEGPAAFASTSKFSSPAVTVIHSDQVQRTYAAIARQGKKDGRVLAVWSRPVESTAEAPEYAQLKFDTRISSIHACAALPDRVAVVHEDGKLSLVSDKLEVVSAQPALRPGVVLESWFFPVAGGFVSAALGEAVVLVLVREGEKAWLSAVVVSEDVLSALGSVELVGIAASTIAGASCSESGSFSVLQSSGLCSTFALSASTRSLVATPLPSPLQLQGLVLPNSAPSTSLPPSSLAIHALKDSIIVVAGITTTSPAKLALLMWNTEYSILLAERVVALPSPLPSPSDLTISTSGSTSTHLVVTISGYILGTLVTLPHTSSIASVLGAARSIVNWLAPTTLFQDENRASLVERIRKDVQAGRVSQADAAFFRWVETEADSASANAGSTAQGTLASATKAAAKIPFPSAFAAALVEAAFPPEDKEEKKEGPPFASGIVSALIWRGAAGQGMLGGPEGLYGALRRKRDWPIMLSALQHVPNIPEDEIIATVRDLLIPLHSTSSDSSAPPPLSNAPPFPNALAHILAYPTSPAPLRLALRTHLRDAEDIVHVLKVLDGWLKRGLQFDVWELDGLQDESWMGNKSRKNVGVSASTGKKKIKGAGMIPALEHILNFTQALLDAHLLTLLQHRPAHSLLRSLSVSLSPLPAHNDALQTLATPLAPFAAEDALDRKSEHQQAPSADASWQSKEEWRKKRRAQLAAEAVAIGDYRFEELVL